MRDPAMELRRVVGKFALLIAFVYVLALVAAVAGLAKGTSTPVLGYAFLLLPAVASGQALLSEPAPPAAHRVDGDLMPAGDHRVGVSAGRITDDPGPHDLLVAGRV